MNSLNRLLGALLVALLSGACGNSVDNPPIGDPPDAPPVNNNCLAEPDYGAVTLGDPKAHSLARPAVPDDPVYYEANGFVNADPQPDRLIVGLFEGAGAFSAGPVVPGTYEIQGAELNFATCGLCVRIVPDVGPDGEPVDKDGYLATGGSVTITSVTPNLAGSVSNITFEHVVIIPGDYVSMPHADGCQTALTSASFDAPVEARVIQQLAPSSSPSNDESVRSLKGLVLGK